VRALRLRLIGVVIATCVIAHNGIIGNPQKALAKINESVNAKSVNVIHCSPRKYSTAPAFSDDFGFILRVKIIDYCPYYEGLLWRKHPSACNWRFRRQRKIKICRQRKWHNCGIRSIINIMRGSMTSIDNYHPGFKPNFRSDILIYHSAKSHRRISSHLFLPEFALVFRHPSGVLDAFGNSCRNTFHGDCGAFRLSDRSAHIPFLTIGYFSRQIDRVPQFFGLITEYKELKNSDKDQSRSKPIKPPIYRRFFVCLVCILLGIPLYLAGMGGRGRRYVGMAVAGMLLTIIGLGFWWITQFPSTWGWWL
jgi:hypothetical protein